MQSDLYDESSATERERKARLAFVLRQHVELLEFHRVNVDMRRKVAKRLRPLDERGQERQGMARMAPVLDCILLLSVLHVQTRLLSIVGVEAQQKEMKVAVFVVELDVGIVQHEMSRKNRNDDSQLVVNVSLHLIWVMSDLQSVRGYGEWAVIIVE